MTSLGSASRTAQDLYRQASDWFHGWPAPDAGSVNPTPLEIKVERQIADLLAGATSPRSYRRKKTFEQVLTELQIKRAKAGRRFSKAQLAVRIGVHSLAAYAWGAGVGYLLGHHFEALPFHDHLPTIGGGAFLISRIWEKNARTRQTWVESKPIIYQDYTDLKRELKRVNQRSLSVLAASMQRSKRKTDFSGVDPHAKADKIKKPFTMAPSLEKPFRFGVGLGYFIAGALDASGADYDQLKELWEHYDILRTLLIIFLVQKYGTYPLSYYPFMRHWGIKPVHATLKAINDRVDHDKSGPPDMGMRGVVNNHDPNRVGGPIARIPAHTLTTNSSSWFSSMLLPRALGALQVSGMGTMCTGVINFLSLR